MAESLFGKRLHELRTTRKKSQQQLADDINAFSKHKYPSTPTTISKSMISRWENGKTDPQMFYVRLLTEYFGVSPSAFTTTDWSLENQANVAIAEHQEVVENLSKSEAAHITTIRQLTPERQTKVYKFATSQLDEQNELDADDANEDNVIDIVTGRATAAGNPINGDDQDGLATMERVSVTDIPHGTDEIVTVDGDSMEPYYPKYSQIFVHWQDTIEDGELAVVHVCDEGVTFKQIYLDDDEKKIILHSLNDKYDDREFEADEIHIIGKVLN